MSVAAGSGTTYKLRQWPNKRQSLHNLSKSWLLSVKQVTSVDIGNNSQHRTKYFQTNNQIISGQMVVKIYCKMIFDDLY